MGGEDHLEQVRERPIWRWGFSGDAERDEREIWLCSLYRVAQIVQFFHPVASFIIFKKKC